jgi:hypothetical protein
MAGARKPGPQCSFSDSIDIEDGTSCRAPTLGPGPIGITSDHDRLFGGLQTPTDSADCVLIAYDRAIQLAPRALYQQIGYALDQIPDVFQGFQVLIAGPDPLYRTVSTVLGSLGIGFLLEVLGDDWNDMLFPLRSGIQDALQAGEHKGAERAGELESAAEELARAFAILVRLVLQATIEYRDGDDPAGSEGSRLKVLERLRSSRMASGFVLGGRELEGPD